MSGLDAISKRVGPRELNDAMMSLLRSPSSLDAPTVRAHGQLPGAPMPPHTLLPVAGFLPRLPAEATTVMPASTADFTARQSGSVWADSSTGALAEMLTTRMLYCRR